ncbi:putative membrane protein (TIGR02226 family) [Dokdonia sp. Hel_I_63]|uniref:BatA domain-containing protein n=1 Tax=Dokdonia sp. Hel_I_63 TaxID=1249996 RepID=UPI00119947B6|nr:BatA domain-containing protein [Dokdonia sp. Hel_I_63]TVZ23798.1 putative membrane protein (TIGR02226 family) [Dokdonia sp. Hel_I_63]
MTLLQPSYLWGLLALAIPILIHLWSRKKVRTIKVGSIQFIAPTKSKESNSIQLNEWWLLLLRCLIISTLVVILAQPHITTTPDNEEVAYLFEPSLLSTADGLARFEQIPLEGRRLLQEDFPLWETGDVIANKEVVPNYWQLAREMEELAADSIVVFTHAFAKALQGKRPTIKKNITWIPVETTRQNEQPLVAIAHKDSLEIINVLSEAQLLGINKEKVAIRDVTLNLTKDSVEIRTNGISRTISIKEYSPIETTIIYNKRHDAERSYLEAALRAISQFTKREIVITAVSDREKIDTTTIDYLIDLSDNPMMASDTPTLYYRPGEIANSLVVPGPAATTSILTKKLTPKLITEEPLVTQLLTWLNLDQELNIQIGDLDNRVMSLEQLQTINIPATTMKKEVKSDMSSTFWILLLVLLVSERILSRIRKQ